MDRPSGHAPHLKKTRKEHRAILDSLLEDSGVEIWYANETGIEGEPRPYRRLAPRGKRPHIVKNGDHIRLNVIGAVCPRTGEFFAIEASHCDTALFQAFLDEARRWLAPECRRKILILDNASWHHSKSLDWGCFEPMHLPPYSPDLNPIEWVWKEMKRKWFNNTHCKTIEQLIEKTDAALLDLFQNPDQARQICRGIRKL